MEQATAALYTINTVVASGTVADDVHGSVVVGALPFEQAYDLFTRGGWGNVRWTENGRVMAYALRRAR